MSFIQNFFTSRDNNSNSATYVGQQDRLWWDPVTNRIYYSDGVTPGGIPVNGGGNAVTDRLVNGSYEFVLDAAGNITAPGAISAVGNVTADYFIGDGSQLTNLPVGGSNITVQNQGTTLTTALNTMNFTGNAVTATNVGNVVTVSINASGGYIPGVFGLIIDGGTAPYASTDFIIDGGLAA